MTTTDTPRTDAAIQFTSCYIPHYIGELCKEMERELNASKAEVEQLNRLMIVWRQRATMSEMDLEASRAEVERLKGLVMEAARKGDELLEPYRLRAEKAETLLKQIHAFVEALNQGSK